MLGKERNEDLDLVKRKLREHEYRISQLQQN